MSEERRGTTKNPPPDRDITRKQLPRWLPTITLAHVKERTRRVLGDRPELRDDICSRVVEGAIAVLNCYLGPTWVRTNILGKRADSFLAPPSKGNDMRGIARGYSRILTLAECLLSMQRVDGIADRVNDLKKKNLQGCFAELQGAMLLRAANTPFHFRRETGAKRDRANGGDFDAIALVNEQRVNCEMKAKCEGTTPTRSGIRSQLKGARDQLPKGMPSIVFLRVPETWMKSKSTRDEVAQGILGHFRDSTRVTTVVIHWDEWTWFADGRWLHEVHFKQYPNTNAPPFFHWLHPIVDSWIAAKRTNWFSLHEAVCSKDELKSFHSTTDSLRLAKAAVNGFGFLASGQNFQLPPEG